MNDLMLNLNEYFTTSENKIHTTSLKVAEVFGKRHKNVLQAINNLEISNEFRRLNFQPVEYIDKKGETRPLIRMTKNGFSLLIMGFTGKEAMGWKVKYIEAFDMMADMISSQSLQAPQTRAEALRLAADLAEQVEGQRLQITGDAPKVAFHDKVSLSDDILTVSEAAKSMGTSRNKLFKFMRHNRWVNRFNEPYQDKIDAKYLDVKIGRYEDPDRGLRQSITTVITGKGLIKLSAMYKKGMSA